MRESSDTELKDIKPIFLPAELHYSIRYGDEEESSVNFIAIEAKSDSRISPGIPHALGYMGAVHRLRKEQRKMDCTCFIPNLIVGELGFLGVC
ncbi:unnamed protein product [Penicillium camemberti]|uniref:Str. FM013 n=1 Tax=Penicillium camemberti (strain FM 013) TaxID=1429867 RepID=A0A0G4PHM0_PENC3|nr:unnamed protein product [Penicillium camemberti]